MSTYFTMTIFKATVCASTEDNRHNSALPDGEERRGKLVLTGHVLLQTTNSMAALHAHGTVIINSLASRSECQYYSGSVKPYKCILLKQMNTGLSNLLFV